MPKPKKQHGAPPKKSRKMNTFAKLSTTTSGKTKPGGDGAKNSQNGKKNQGQNQTKQQQKRKPIVPFARGDRILLIGEGELSSPSTIHYMHPYMHTCIHPSMICNKLTVYAYIKETSPSPGR